MGTVTYLHEHVINKHVTNSIRLYKINGKSALGRYLKEVPDVHKSEVIKRIRKELNDEIT